MLNRLPRWTPPLDDMLADIGKPTPAALAAALHVHTRTAQTWQARNEAPRPALLAIWWLTRWGQSACDCETRNRADLCAMIAACEHAECERLRAEISRLMRIGDFGAANSPTLFDATQMPRMK